MLRLLACCGLSIFLYIVLFSFSFDRPLSLGLLNLEIQQKSSRLANLPSPKLVILAGSNGPYSHSCVVIGSMLNLPCENAGVAVGIGLDDLFAQYGPSLHHGDIVYMPMETEQYIVTRAQNNTSADGAMLLRYNRQTLRALGTERVLGAIFSTSFLDFLDSLAEMMAAHFHLLSASSLFAAEYNIEGDRIGTSLATADQKLLPASPPIDPSADRIDHAYGSEIIHHFVADQTRAGVEVIGGLPTQFQTAQLPPATIDAIRSVYVSAGGGFIILNDFSQYPRADFYDSEDHLAQPCQYKHSIEVAEALGRALRRAILPPSAALMRIASTCPS
jgi:hypothetical protein